MCPNSRGRPLGRWRDRVKEYMCERCATRVEGLDQVRRECLDRERWRLFCRGHTLGGHSWREQGVRPIDSLSVKVCVLGGGEEGGVRR